MKYTKKTLSNGLRYLFIPKKDTQSVFTMVLVKTGADYESKKENGLSHFLEHVCFKGTLKRPTAKDIALEFDSIGAEINAFTGRDYTGYYAKAHKKHGSHILEILSDIYLHSTFPKEELKKEKGVVIQEINMYMDDPQYRVGKLSVEQLYGDQPIGREILGTKETVSSFTDEHVRAYHAKHYSPKNTLVIVAGNFDQKKIEKQISTAFLQMKSAKKNVYPKTVVSQKSPQVAIEHKATDQTHLILSFRMFGYMNKNITSASLLTDALGSGMSSRLFQKMREELGICYYISASMNTHKEEGVLSISAGVANDRVEEALKGIVEEIRLIRSGGVTETEFTKVKECRLSSLVMHLETSEDYAHFFGTSEIRRGQIKTPEERSNMIRKVRLSDVNNLAKAIFRPEGGNLAVIGPFGKKEKTTFLNILKTI